MKGKIVLILMALALNVFAATETTPPREDSLLAAWEEFQRNDAKTERFERLEPQLYQLHTSRFPYQGKVRVLHLSIEDNYLDDDEKSWLGVVEVELVDALADFLSKHAHSYSTWARNNIFYYAENRWLSAQVWQEQLNQQRPEKFSSCTEWRNYFWIFLLLILLLFLSWIARKSSQQMKTALAAQEKILTEHERILKLSEQAVEISADSNRILKEILAALREK